MLAPFFGFYDQEDAQRQAGLLKLLKYVISTVPSYKQAGRTPYFYDSWKSDPLAPADMPISQYLDLHKEVRHIQDYPEQFFDGISLPVLSILGGLEDTCSPLLQREIFSFLQMQDKNKIQYDDVGHYMLADGDWNKFIMNDILYWLNTHI